MRLSELTEATRPAYLYHGTGISNLLQAVHDDCLNAGEGAYSEPYLCFTRDMRIAFKFASGKSASAIEIWSNCDDLWGGAGMLSGDPTEEEYGQHIPLAVAEQSIDGWKSNGGGCIIVFDQQKLRQRYKIKPYCDNGDRMENGKKWEMEERIYRNIAPLKPMIVGIKILGSLGAIGRTVIHGDESLHITPHPEFEAAWRWCQSKAI